MRDSPSGGGASETISVTGACGSAVGGATSVSGSNVVLVVGSGGAEGLVVSVGIGVDIVREESCRARAQLRGLTLFTIPTASSGAVPPFGSTNYR